MKTFKYLLTAAAGIALSGCAITNVNDVNSMRTTTAQGGTPFTQALTDEYRSQAVNEADQEYEWDDAAFFARKGLRASKGEAVPPANVAAAPEWAGLRHGDIGPVFQIPAARVPELANARARLVAFLDGGGREAQPVIAAHAQGSYDCWLEEEWEIEGDTECRDEFLKTEKLFRMTQAPAPAAATTMKVSAVQVFFDFDRSNISEAAARTLRQTAANAMQGKVIHINLTGHTDSSGPDAYNQALSERRAAAVKAELVKDGVPADEITSAGVGKAGQLLPTADGVREPQNRRTEIILQ
jgi:OOP family OmpA-OmpF porin